MLIEFRWSAGGVADLQLFTPVIPAIYILLATAISIDLLVYKRQYTWPGLGIVFVEIPVFFIWKRYSPRTVS